MVQPATPQTETEQNNQRQQRAFAEHQRRDHARHRFLGYSGSAYGSDLWSSRPRYAKDTRPSFVSFTTLAAPKPARKSYEKGRRAAAADNLDAAARHLEQAVELYPDYAAAWALLGRVRVHAGRNVDAARALRRSVEIDSKYLEPYPYLAYLAVIESDWPEVVRLGDEMIAVNSLFTLGHYYRGYALLQQGR